VYCVVVVVVLKECQMSVKKLPSFMLNLTVRKNPLLNMLKQKQTITLKANMGVVIEKQIVGIYYILLITQ